MGNLGAVFFGGGVNTLWIGTHGLVMQLSLIGLAVLFGALWFCRDAGDRLVGGLKAVSLVTFLALLVLMITGLVPDVRFEKGTDFSGTFKTEFGTFTTAVSDENVAGFTGPLLFDMMEHCSFIVPGLALLFCFLVWHYGKRVIEDATVRRSALWVLTLTACWILFIGHLGFYVSKVLTFPFSR